MRKKLLVHPLIKRLERKSVHTEKSRQIWLGFKRPLAISFMVLISERKY